MSQFDNASLNNLRVLHIEANDLDAMLVLRGLEGLAERLVVQRATSSQALRRLSETEGWDIVLADPYTPNLSIPELLQAARNVCPILLVAGPVPARDALSWGRLGLVDIVAKHHSSANQTLLRAGVRRAVKCRDAYMTLQAHGWDSNAENLPLISSQQRSQRDAVGHQAPQSRQAPNLFLQG
jgi:CheY-like chemotaxis protein